LLFFPLIGILYALRLESQKYYQHGLDAGPLEFQFFWGDGMSHHPIQNSVTLFQGHRQNTIKILLKKILSASAITIMSWQDVTQSSLCSGVKECGKKCAHNFLFPKSSFRIRRTTVLGMLKDSAIIFDVIRRTFLNKAATAAIFTSVQSIMDCHPSRHLLPALFHLEIENTT